MPGGCEDTRPSGATSPEQPLSIPPRRGPLRHEGCCEPWPGTFRANEV